LEKILQWLECSNDQVNKKLKDVLRDEKLFGPSTSRDPDKQQSNFQTFKENYFLVEEPSGQYKPIIVKDFSGETRDAYPIMYFNNSIGRCAFVQDEKHQVASESEHHDDEEEEDEHEEEEIGLGNKENHEKKAAPAPVELTPSQDAQPASFYRDKLMDYVSLLSPERHPRINFLLSNLKDLPTNPQDIKIFKLNTLHTLTLMEKAKADAVAALKPTMKVYRDTLKEMLKLLGPCQPPAHPQDDFFDLDKLPSDYVDIKAFNAYAVQKMEDLEKFRTTLLPNSMASGLVSGSVATLAPKRDLSKDPRLAHLGQRVLSLSGKEKSNQSGKVSKRKKKVRAVPGKSFYHRPGYCENCNVKYDKFCEVVFSITS
jgi:hypothetical protein